MRGLFQPGASVQPGDLLLTIEAMKMEAAITSPVAGTVSRVVIVGASEVSPGDLLVQLA